MVSSFDHPSCLAMSGRYVALRFHLRERASSDIKKKKKKRQHVGSVVRTLSRRRIQLSVRECQSPNPCNSRLARSTSEGTPCTLAKESHPRPRAGIVRLAPRCAQEERLGGAGGGGGKKVTRAPRFCFCEKKNMMKNVWGGGGASKKKSCVGKCGTCAARIRGDHRVDFSGRVSRCTRATWRCHPTRSPKTQRAG